MSRKIKGNGKHLTFSDRVYIEQELVQKSSFRDIAIVLGKDPSTISKEIKSHFMVTYRRTYKSNKCVLCANFKKCKKTVGFDLTNRPFCIMIDKMSIYFILFITRE